MAKKTKSQRKAEAAARKARTGMSQTKTAMVIKIAIGILFLIISFGTDNGDSLAGGLILGVALIAWGVVPWLMARRTHTAPAPQTQPIAPVRSSSAIDFNAELEAIPRVEISVSPRKAERHDPTGRPPIDFTNITKRTNLDRLFPLVVLDTETTGLNPSKHEIIEVSAIKFDRDFRPISCYSTLVKPRRPIPPSASAVNNITDDMVCDCPSFVDIADDFSKYISGCNIVGHNVLFDLNFLYAGGCSLPSGVKYYDTLNLARYILVKEGQRVYDHHDGVYRTTEEYDVEDYKLETLCEYYGIMRNGAHRSLSDCLATAKVFEHIISDKMAL